MSITMVFGVERITDWNLDLGYQGASCLYWLGCKSKPRLRGLPLTPMTIKERERERERNNQSQMEVSHGKWRQCNLIGSIIHVNLDLLFVVLAA